jgi:hypothetical protein
LRNTIAEAANTLEKPTEEEVEESRLPKKVGTAYWAMYAHGMNMRIKSAEEEKVTCDSGVTSAVWRRSRGHAGTRSGYLETAEYVGWIKEILEVDYRNHCCIVLVCSWIPGTLKEPTAKVMRDDYGFEVGNFIWTMLLGADSFAFPTQCVQVFYLDDNVRNHRSGGD